MPVGQVFSPVQVELVVLPHAHDVGHQVHHLRRPVGGEAHLPQPVLGRVGTLLFVQPVPVENGEIDPSPAVRPLKLLEHGGEGGQVPPVGRRTARILVVAAGELESEVEESFRVVLGMAHVVGAGQGLKGSPRPRDLLGPAQPDQPVVVPGPGIQSREVNPTGVVTLDPRLHRRGQGVQPVGPGPVPDGEFPGPGRAGPDAHLVGLHPAQHGTVGERGVLIGSGPGLGLTPQAGQNDRQGDQPGKRFHRISSRKFSRTQFSTVRIPFICQAVRA